MDEAVKYDFENDPKLSDNRKAACRKNYEEMSLNDIDHLFLSAHKYDKKSGLPIYKKPRSIHELVHLNMQRNYDLLARIMQLEERLAKFEQRGKDTGYWL